MHLFIKKNKEEKDKHTAQTTLYWLSMWDTS